MKHEVAKTSSPGDFHEHLISENHITGFREWLFLPSMLFGAGDKWWGKKDRRDTPHEGIDIFMYRATDVDIKYLSGTTKIPAIFSGKVEKVLDDFLGKSIFISSNTLRQKDCRFYALYGHTSPSDGITPGAVIKAGEVIGTISDKKRTSARSHLHISLAWVPDSVTIESLDWDVLSKNKEVTLINPFEVIDLPHSMINK